MTFPSLPALGLRGCSWFGLDRPVTALRQKYQFPGVTRELHGRRSHGPAARHRPHHGRSVGRSPATVGLRPNSTDGKSSTSSIHRGRAATVPTQRVPTLLDRGLLRFERCVAIHTARRNINLAHRRPFHDSRCTHHLTLDRCAHLHSRASRSAKTTAQQEEWLGSA